MNPLTMTSHVGADGVLHVTLPVVNCDVELTIKELPPDNDSIEDHCAFIDSIAGSWGDDVKRPEQPPYEERESF